jgi:mono/diheme cytochrome c family protein
VRRVRAWRWGALVGLLAAFVIAGYLGQALWTARPAERVVAVPELSADARIGRDVFDRRCAACHGASAGGTSAGPALVHQIYRPAHHGDVAFALAVQRGVRAHHWTFGDMPPPLGLSASDVDAVVRYVRELQRANGIR